MRICYNCQYIDIDYGEADWSEVTPGSNGHILCILGYFTLHFKNDNPQLSLRRALEKARTCIEYKHSEEAIRLGIPDE